MANDDSRENAIRSVGIHLATPRARLNQLATVVVITIAVVVAGCAHRGSTLNRASAPDGLRVEVHEIDAAVTRGDGLDRLLQRFFPVRVRDGVFRTEHEGYQPMICVEPTRGWRGRVGAGADAGTDESHCNMVTVVLDDLTIEHPGPMLRAAPLEAFRSIEYLTGPQAGPRFGYAGARAGVLLLYTRRGDLLKDSRF